MHCLTILITKHNLPDLIITVPFIWAMSSEVTWSAFAPVPFTDQEIVASPLVPSLDSFRMTVDGLFWYSSTWCYQLFSKNLNHIQMHFDASAGDDFWTVYHIQHFWSRWLWKDLNKVPKIFVIGSIITEKSWKYCGYFCHSIFKRRLLQRLKKASICEKGICNCFFGNNDFISVN